MSIWKYREIKKEIPEEYQLTLNEGNTPIEELRLEEGQGLRIRLKREDRNPNGSWKDRGTAFKMSLLKMKGIKEGVISSSGNAAISLLNYARLYPEFKLHIVVSEDSINPTKLEILKHLTLDTHHEIHLSKFAKQTRAQLAAKGIENLSSSTDSEILKGYWSLGFELAKEVNSKNIPAIFVQASSGTALVGMVQGLSLKIEIHQIPKIFVCQTTAVHPVADALSIEVETENLRLADAITDKSMLRLPQVIKIIDQTKGDTFAISNLELTMLYQQVDLMDALSHTSLLSVAAAAKAQEKYPEMDFEGSICVASGR